MVSFTPAHISPDSHPDGSLDEYHDVRHDFVMCLQPVDVRPLPLRFRHPAAKFLQLRRNLCILDLAEKDIGLIQHMSGFE